MWSLLSLIRLILQIYSWVIIAAAVMSWLVAFGVVNTRNQFIRWVVDFLYRITEPAGLIDVAPTILDALHLPPAPTFHGISLLHNAPHAI